MDGHGFPGTLCMHIHGVRVSNLFVLSAYDFRMIHNDHHAYVKHCVLSRRIFVEVGGRTAIGIKYFSIFTAFLLWLNFFADWDVALIGPAIWESTCFRLAVYSLNLKKMCFHFFMSDFAKILSLLV